MEKMHYLYWATMVFKGKGGIQSNNSRKKHMYQLKANIFQRAISNYAANKIRYSIGYKPRLLNVYLSSAEQKLSY